MADISNVNVHEIKDLYESLECLSCEYSRLAISIPGLTLHSPNHDPGSILVNLLGAAPSSVLCI